MPALQGKQFCLTQTLLLMRVTQGEDFAHACQPSVPILGHLNNENVRAHVLEFRRHLKQRLPTGTKSSDIPCIVYIVNCKQIVLSRLNAHVSLI